VKKVVAMALFNILVLCIVLPVFAEGVETNLSAVYDEQNERVTIIGNAGAYNDKQNILVMILRPGKTLNNISPNIQLQDYSAMAHIMDTKTDRLGNYTVTYDMEEPSGVYTVIAGGMKTGEPITTQFTHYSKTEKEQVFQAIQDIRAGSGENKPADIGLILCDKYVALKIDFPLFVGLADKSLINQAVAYAPALDDLNQMYGIIKEYSTVQAINEADTDEKIKALITNYDEILNLDKTLYSGQKLTDAAKEQIEAGMKNYKKFATAKDVRSEFLKYSVVAAISEVRSWIDIRDIITDYNSSVLQMDLTDYNALSSSGRDSVDKALADMSFATLGEVTKAFNTLVAAQHAKENATTRPGGSGSGSSGQTQMNLSISQTPQEVKPPQENVESFVDLGSVPWAVESIEKLVQKEIIARDESKLFRPNDFVTREEFIKLIVLAFDVEQQEQGRNFKDVPLDSWYHQYVTTAAEAGLVNGISKDEFGTGRMITRQDMAVMLYRAAQYAGITFQKPTAPIFQDNDDIADYAKEAVGAMGEAKVISGQGDGKFAPTINATRAEAATIISRILNAL